MKLSRVRQVMRNILLLLAFCVVWAFAIAYFGTYGFLAALGAAICGYYALAENTR